ncbi:MAG: hypothetical protein FGF53_06355 [Candidatus Brockarchaeota archaeon]|nr:hypothetical protein [Candidatus Brockarchaeota archaeon]
MVWEKALEGYGMLVKGPLAACFSLTIVTLTRLKKRFSKSAPGSRFTVKASWFTMARRHGRNEEGRENRA